MKRTQFALSALTASFAASAALAGGYIAPLVETEVTPVVVSEPLSWQGAYVGGTLGYGFAGDDEVGIGQGQDFVYTTPDTLELSGAAYGWRLGYRMQRTGAARDWVFAGELGYEAGGISDEFDTAGYEASNEISNVLSLRLKSGVLNQAKNTWFYGIAGISQADFDYQISGTNGAAGAVDIDESGKSATGYILGLGIERKLSADWSVTGEWEYHNYGKEHLEDVNGKSTEATPDWQQLKLGLNYQF
ncbi:outer membrane protein [Paracoccus sediminicola]|uniref:outer membrane protein n=1 Tax=Paracoccus sediminicola TaxID=3017783 RepID=UPI0022F13812|nr:outer membrane beta-barrel protein [Paracoccus sediminicola]WBU56873.1 outer membrane beta-barrel protein [Paracoccus sediminicola]